MSTALVRSRRTNLNDEADGLAERAYLLIRRRILEGELPYGAAVSRRDLAAELGMSLLPVSEALQRLRNEALIETVPRVGTRVRIPTPQDIRGFYVVREALETQAARLFAEKATADEKRELMRLAEELDDNYRRCAGAPDTPSTEIYDLRDQHMRFHLHIASMAHCPFLTESIERNQILIFNWFFDRLFGSPGLPEHWHVDLARELISSDVEAADREMRKHVRYRMEELLLRLEPFFSLNGKHLAKAFATR